MFGVAVVRRVYVDCSMFCCVFGLGEFPREKLQLFNASAMFMWLVHVVLPYEFFHARRRGCIGSAAFSSCSCSLLMIDPSHGRSIGRMDDRTIELCDRSIDRADERSVHRADGSTIDRADRRLSGQIGDQVDMLAEAKVPDPAPPHPTPPHFTPPHPTPPHHTPSHPTPPCPIPPHPIPLHPHPTPRHLASPHSTPPHPTSHFTRPHQF